MAAKPLKAKPDDDLRSTTVGSTTLIDDEADPLADARSNLSGSEGDALDRFRLDEGEDADPRPSGTRGWELSWVCAINIIT